MKSWIVAVMCWILGCGAAVAYGQTYPTHPPYPNFPAFPNGPGQIVIPNVHRHAVWAPKGNAIVLDKVGAHIEISDQISSTQLELTLRNPGPAAQEAVVIFPVPDGVTVRSIQYDGAGPEPTALVLPAAQARAMYAEIVRTMKDPALVEFVGMNLIQSSVFPIAPGGIQKLRLTLEQVLPSDGDRVDYSLLRSSSFAESETGWTVTFDIRSKTPLATVYSPTHTLSFAQHTPNHITGSVGGVSASIGTMRLSYLKQSAANETPSFSVFVYPDASVSEKGGYFLVLGGVPGRVEGAAPGAEREVVMVLDRSGSMQGEKIKQAQAAAVQVLEGLREGEAFNVIDYSDSVRSFADRPVVKSKKTCKQARAYIESIRAEGGTNIRDAILEALRPKATAGKLPLVIFLTDGLPTVGERNEVRLRSLIESANNEHRRIFSFGVGYDVNAPLLTAIAQKSRGMSTFVLPDEDVEAKVSRVFKGLTGPVVAMPSMKVLDGDGAVSTRLAVDLQPPELPDLFEGDQVVIAGRYLSESPFTLRVEGTCGKDGRVFDVRIDPANATSRHDFVPRTWASRRIAALLEEIRQSGAEGATAIAGERMKELVDEIVSLSTRYGILTEYTAFLAKESTDLRATAMPAVRVQLNDNLQSRITAHRAGAGGFNQEANLKALASGGSGGGLGKDVTTTGEAARPGRVAYLSERMNQEVVETVRQVSDRTFYRRNNRWVDARILEKDSDSPDRTVEFGTDEYLKLADRLALEGRAGLLAQGGDILISVGKERILVRQPQVP